jgi:hypothetical protein
MFAAYPRPPQYGQAGKEMLGVEAKLLLNAQVIRTSWELAAQWVGLPGLESHENRHSAVPSCTDNDQTRLIFPLATIRLLHCE